MSARGTIGVAQLGARTASELAARSRHALAGPLTHAAELSVAHVADEAAMIGAYQRGASIDSKYRLFRRGSGGPVVHVGPGTVHVLLALASSAALVACSPDKLVNRYVRPILRALTRLVGPTHYFGRDWISVQHRPAAWVGFAHSASTGRAVVEAFVAVTSPFAVAPRASFLGKEPGTLAAITGRDVSVESVAGAIAAAYPAFYALEAAGIEPAPVADGPEEDLRADPPWAATLEEAIGEVAAGRDRAGVLRVGGDLLVSREAIARVEHDLASLPPEAPPAEVSRLVDAAFTAPGVVLDGVRSLASIAAVIDKARLLEARL